MPAFAVGAALFLALFAWTADALAWESDAQDESSTFALPLMTSALSFEALWPGGFVLTPQGMLEREKTLLVFGTLDAGPGQVFSGSGLKYAPVGGLDSSGFRILARAGSGQWREPKKPLSAETKAEGYLMFGGDMMTGRGTFGLYLGPEIAMTIPAQAGTRKRNGLVVKPVTGHGLRIMAELWDHPTPDTLFQLSTSISSAKAEIWGRTAVGHRLDFLHASLEGFGGLEAEVTAAASYTKWRAGLHVTGFKLFNMQWRVSAGREQASDKQRGLYVTGGLHWAR
jgi:Cellulose biosynthesis protein BcsS